MKPFDQLFPDFISSCAKLHDALMPAAMILLVLSFAFLFWQGPPHPIELVRHLIKLFVVILLINNANVLINDGQAIMQQFVQENVPSRPENVAQSYKDKLTAAHKSKNEQEGWWHTIFGGGLFESFIYAILILISWLAMILNFYISVFQNIVLLICWVLTPLLFGCFVIPPVAGLAMGHVLRILGILSWPLGLALAAAVTDGLLGVMTDLGSFASGVSGDTEFVLTNLLAIATIALWILFSTFLAPGFMQRLIAGTSGAASMLSRAGTLLTNTGSPLAASAAPVVASAAAAGLGAAWSIATWPFRSADRGNDAGPAPLIKLDPSPGSAVDPPPSRSMSSSDPTLQNEVMRAMQPANEDVIP